MDKEQSMDLDHLLSNLKNKKKIIKEKKLRLLIEKVKEVCIEEPNILPVQTPINICGDIHGQFHDLLELFKTGGELPDQQYIFMGDFVDRGYYSVETLEYLLCLKLRYPSKITLLRGNHESRGVSIDYGFYDECILKYGNHTPWKYFCEVFDFFPLAAIVEGKILCVHGGLSPDIKTLDQINSINRLLTGDLPSQGPLVDLLWSDPEDSHPGWMKNSARGLGFLFGSRVVAEFNEMNGLDLIARSHQLVMEGFKYKFSDKLITVWSAPNYCYRCGNKATILKIDADMDRKFEFFDSASQEASKIEKYKIILYQLVQVRSLVSIRILFYY